MHKEIIRGEVAISSAPAQSGRALPLPLCRNLKNGPPAPH
jgi:hypothetical protein